MTTQRGYTEPPPRLELVESLRTAAGSPLDVEVTVTNAAAAPRVVSVAAIGVEAGWLPAPVRTSVLGPGESVVETLTLSPPTGTLPAQYPLAFTAQALDPVTGRPTASGTGLADAVLVVNPRNQLALDLRPRDATAVASQRVKLILRNDGPNPARVRLEVQSSPMLNVDFQQDEVEVGPGATVEVRGRASLDRSRVAGDRTRFPYIVTARGNEAMRYVEGSVTRRPVIGSGWLKAAAILAVLSIWVAAAVVFIPQMADRIGQSQADERTSAVSGEGDDGSGGGEAGDDESDGSDDPGEPGGSGDKDAGSDTSDGLALSGTVTGTVPEGVTVNLSAKQLVDEEMQGAPGIGVPAAEFGNTGMSLASAFPSAMDRTPRDRSTTTTEDGSWAFPRVRRPGYYLLTFSKPGYQSQSFVVDSATEAAAQPLEVEMLAGQGRLSGEVTGPGGLVGGATITITDGTNTLTTSSDSMEHEGEWAVNGLSTPGTYIVRASRPGMSSESVLVSLPAGGADQADLELKAGVAALVGRVRAKDDSGDWAGAGGITVSVRGSDGEERTVTTLTQGATVPSGGDRATVTKQLAGDFTMPGLTAPGKYVVTFSGAGLQSQTSKVSIGAGESLAKLNADLVSASGWVTGRVLEKGRDGKGVVGAALTLENAENGYKTTTTNADRAANHEAGSFLVDGVAPGIYTLSLQLFGFTEDHVTVRVRAGEPTRIIRKIDRRAGAVLAATSHIQGHVVDAGTGAPLRCAGECIEARVTDPGVDDGTADDKPYATSFLAGDMFTLPEDKDAGLLPGLHHVHVSAPHYETQTVAVEVPANSTVDVGSIGLFPAPKIVGTITTVIGQPSGNTCIWAVPAGDDTVPADGCDTTAEASVCQPDDATFDLTKPGPQTVCAFVDGAGAYSIELPVHGSYRVYVQTSDTEYLSPPAVNLNLGLGVTQTYAVQLHRLGRLAVLVREPGPGGNLVASVGANVDLLPAPGPTTPPWEETNSAGRTQIIGLRPGTYTVTATDADDPTLTGSAAVGVGLDQDFVVTLAMTNPIAAVVGRVTANIDGVGEAIDGATISVTAPVAYQDDSAIQGTATMVTDTQGCFAIQGVDAADPPPRDPCDTDWPGTSRGRTTFLASTASSIQVSADGYQPLFLTNQQLRTDRLNTFSLEADPIPLGQVTIGTNPGNTDAAAWSQARFVVDTVPPGGGGSIHVAATGLGEGVLSWNDTRLSASGLVRPGTYNVSVSLPGYRTATAALECTVGGDGCVWQEPPFVLQKLGTLTVGANAAAGSVNGARFTLLKGGTAVQTLTAAADQSAVTFGGVEPEATDYAVRVQAAGHTFGTTGPGATALPISCAGSPSITITAGADTACTVTVTRLGAVTGTVNGFLGPPDDPTTSTRQLAGAQVVVARCTDTATIAGDTYCTDTSPTERFTGTTAGDGTFRVTGTTTTEGLNGGNWLVAASLAGYSQLPVPDDALPGVLVQGLSTSSDTAVRVDLRVDTVNVTVRLRDQSNRLVAGAIVELYQGPDLVATAVNDGTTYVFTGAIPGAYTLSARGGGLTASTTPYDVVVGSGTQTFTMQVSRGANVAQGRVTSTDSASGVEGVTVTLVCVGTSCPDPPAVGTDGNVLTQQTGSNGSFLFRNVPDGTFELTFDKPGYLDHTEGPFSFQHELAPVDPINPVLQPITRNVTVTVTTQWDNDDLSGGSVTLTPTDPNGTALAPVLLTGGDGTFTASFLQVRSGCWNVTVTLPTNHFGAIGALQGSPNDPGLTCSGNLEVPRVQGGTINVSRAVNEGRLNLAATAVALNGHTPPTAATVTITRGGTTVYSNASFPISSTATQLWVPAGGAAYTVTARPNQPPATAAFWPAESITVSIPGNQPGAGAVSRTMPLNEIPGELVVTVQGTGPGNQADLELASDDGQEVPAEYATGVTTSGGRFTFTLPSGSWTVTATLGAGTDSGSVTLTALTQNLTLQP